MREKIKFAPRIYRVKLNPEQAVLSCNCYGGHGWQISAQSTAFIYSGPPALTACVIGRAKDSNVSAYSGMPVSCTAGSSLMWDIPQVGTVSS